MRSGGGVSMAKRLLSDIGSMYIHVPPPVPECPMMADPQTPAAPRRRRVAKPKSEAPALPPEPVPVAAEASPPIAVDEEKKKDKKGKKRKKDKKAKKNKEAVVLRFEGDQLALVDQRAEALGLSRAAWVRMVVAQALDH